MVEPKPYSQIATQSTLIEGVNKYVIKPYNANPFAGPIADSVLGDVANLTDIQLRKNPEPGFTDKFGDTFDNFTISGNWSRFTLNRGQLANDGSLHQLGVEVTLPGSDLTYARFNYTNQIYWPISQSREWVIGLRTAIGYGIGYGDSDELPFFNNFFAGGLSTSGGVVRGYEENSLGPQSTAGARYLTQRGISLLRDENGDYVRQEDGSVRVDPNATGYETQPVFNLSGNPILDADGNPQVALAVQNFYLDDDYDSFGGNILTTATLELLFPLPFVPNRNQVRSAFFIDAGNVFSSNCTERQRMLRNCTNFDVGELRYSAGISVTYLSPFGPLTFYLATPFGDKKGDDTKSFDFTVGSGF